ncbi:hypothetical protein RRG08_000501 [Elysia crispata]|uniref:Uncharacterized protein n=1 Tax=Elysia crispata TaxID=231223 RepID=A0AAE1CWS0_9GAST|nr:hypothetical protein RRG08_000501 [Elysia crispata]
MVSSLVEGGLRLVREGSISPNQGDDERIISFECGNKTSHQGNNRVCLLTLTARLSVAELNTQRLKSFILLPSTWPMTSCP